MKKIFFLICLLFLTSNIFAFELTEVQPKFKITSRQQALSYKKFLLVYDKDRKTALYTLYELTNEMAKNQGVKRTDRFIPDKRVDSCPVTSDYAKTGFDRGHLVPAEDMDDDNITMKESFYMTNITPQLPKFNRGIWKRMEDSTRTFAKEYGNVKIISGPIYDSLVNVYEMKNGIDIPTRFYKILYYKKDGRLKTEAYLFENKEYKHTKQNPVPLSNFKVNIEEIEKATGIDFLE